jgi:DNA-binding transcriptional ArsR family regulator
MPASIQRLPGSAGRLENLAIRGLPTGAKVAYWEHQPSFHPMSEPSPSPQPPKLDLESICLLLSDPTRWLLLRELAKGQALPVNELGQRLGRSPEAISKHLAVMRRLGVAEAGFGRLYSLSPSFRPEPGAAVLDFGHCTVRLDTPLT